MRHLCTSSFCNAVLIFVCANLIIICRSAKSRANEKQSQACLNYAECSLSSNDSAKVLQISDTAKNRPAEFC